MPAVALPPPGAVQDILIWHQGALGDLLLAGPALVALSRHYPGARLTGVGHPERWGVLAPTLPLAALWDGGEAIWSHLFVDSPLPSQLLERLASFQLALVFRPRPQAELRHRLGQAGIPGVHWVPSFPQGCREAVATFQARHLAALGLLYDPRPLRLVLQDNPPGDEGPELPGKGPWAAVAPGSGHPRKNWPLSHYYEITRALAWQHGARVVWLTGPSEAGALPFIRPLAAAQGHLLLANLPLKRVAAVLRRGHLFLGGDSGLTHLAAAVGTRHVLALFGPTDPQIWAPLGEQVTVLTGPCPQAPCTPGREITCPEPRCLTELSPRAVLKVAIPLLAQG